MGMRRAGAPALAALAVAGVCGEGVAAEAPRIEEILVTATKRETDLQVTPVAITALTGTQLDFLQIRDFNGYLDRVPGLSAIDQGPGRKRYLLRGVTSQDSNLSQATVAQYLDEVPITNNDGQQPDPHLADVERVEVLRGPQGTLFGARSMAGAVRTVTRKPQMDRVSGSAEITGSATHFGGGNVNAEGVANVPLVDGKLAARAIAFYSYQDGYVDNVFAGGLFNPTPSQLPPGIRNVPPVQLPPQNQTNFSDVKTYGGRLALRWLPNDRLTVDAMGLAEAGHIGAPGAYNVQATGNESRGLITAVSGDTGNDDSLYIGSVTAGYDLDWANLTVVGAYSRRDNLVVNGADVAGPLVNSGAGSINNFGQVVTNKTLEARLTSRDDGPFRALLGGYAYWQLRHSHMLQYVGFGNVTIADGLNDDHSHEAAVFGELGYNLTSRWEITAGARYTRYLIYTARYHIIPPPGGFVAVGQDPVVPRFEEKSGTYKVETSFKVNDEVFLYALASNGFRPGGYNGNTLPGFNLIPANFTADHLWNYELGAKTKLWDDRLTWNTAVYRIDWHDIQVLSFAPAPVGPMLLPFTTNASSARIVGLESEISAVVSENVSVNASLNHFFRANLTGAAPISPSGLAPQPGDPLPYDADWSFNLGGEYHRPLTADLEGFIRVDWSYIGHRTTGFRPLTISGQPNNAYNSLPRYNLVDLRVGVSSGPWRATVFAQNAFDARPILNQMNFAPLPVTIRTTRTPRTIGATLRREF